MIECTFVPGPSSSYSSISKEWKVQLILSDWFFRRTEGIWAGMGWSCQFRLPRSGDRSIGESICFFIERVITHRYTSKTQARARYNEWYISQTVSGPTFVITVTEITSYTLGIEWGSTYPDVQAWDGVSASETTPGSSFDAHLRILPVVDGVPELYTIFCNCK